MIAITVTRKPLSEPTVALNVLKHGCGSLNIDAGRVRSSKPPQPTTAPGWDAYNRTNAEQGYRGRDYAVGGATYHPSPGGRWPANMVLQHDASCVCTGTQETPGVIINRFTDGMKPFGEGAGHAFESVAAPPVHIDVWKCSLGCPVLLLDQNAPTTGSKDPNPRNNKAHQGFSKGGDVAHISTGSPADVGGASRFFKQVQSRSE
jgi:hypothetical protein